MSAISIITDAIFVFEIYYPLGKMTAAARYATHPLFLLLSTAAMLSAPTPNYFM